MQTKGFYINYAGDASVGIFPAEWIITGEFSFENKEELEQFRSKIKEAWEYASDTPIGVETFEERLTRLNKEQTILK